MREPEGTRLCALDDPNGLFEVAEKIDVDGLVEGAELGVLDCWPKGLVEGLVLGAVDGKPNGLAAVACEDS